MMTEEAQQQLKELTELNSVKIEYDKPTNKWWAMLLYDVPAIVNGKQKVTVTIVQHEGADMEEAIKLLYEDIKSIIEKEKAQNGGH